MARLDLSGLMILKWTRGHQPVDHKIQKAGKVLRRGAPTQSVQRRASLCRSLVPLFISLVASTTQGLAGQGQWKSAHLQIGGAIGSGDFAGGAALFTAELAVAGSSRLYVQVLDWDGLGCASAEDGGPNPCHDGLRTWEAGIRQGLGVSERVAPFVGVGLGAFDHGSPERTRSPAVIVSAGLDVSVVRLSWVHQEVFDQRLDRLYGKGLRFSGFFIGFAITTPLRQ